MSEHEYPAAKMHTFGPIAWCRYGVVIRPWLCLWWGRWGHFLSTWKLVNSAELDACERERAFIAAERDEALAGAAQEDRWEPLSDLEARVKALCERLGHVPPEFGTKYWFGLFSSPTVGLMLTAEQSAQLDEIQREADAGSAQEEERP